MAKQLYIIKGTGLSLDGTVVNVSKRVGDYCVVSPPNTVLDIQGTMVHEKCLQLFSDDTQMWTYQFTVVKRNENPSCPDTETRSLQIHKCIRNTDLETILEYIDTNLRPILRME